LILFYNSIEYKKIVFMKKLIIIGLSLLSINTFAQDYVYKGLNNVEAKIGLSSEENTETSETVSADCYDPANIGQRISAQGCDGLLIVDNNILYNLSLGNSYTTSDNEIINSYADNNIFTGQVTNMNNLFYNKSVLYPISGWNVSNVKTMSNIFRNSNFNQNINSWDVSNVTSLIYAFSEATNFNQPLNNWDVSNVTNMLDLFSYATNFNQPLNNWNVENVTNMNNLFLGATNFNQPLNNWNTSNAINMITMFKDAASFYQDISSWCVENIEYRPSAFDANSMLRYRDDFKPKWGEPCS